MEFIQKKSDDRAVEHFLPLAADQEISLVWDRYEAQLPECGFCESGLSCRDCLQGPCISHPFRDHNKLGVCGKNKDLLAAQALLRLAMQGTMGHLDRLETLATEASSARIEPADKAETERLLKQRVHLLEKGTAGVEELFPEALTDRWDGAGIRPEGLARDLIKASQRLEGGLLTVEETVLWAFKTSLLGFAADELHRRLWISLFGRQPASEVDISLGVLDADRPNIAFYGHFSPILRRAILQVAEKKGVAVVGVATEPFLPPYHLPIATNSGSQEIPIMTGAVDLVVAGVRFVNPSLAEIAKRWQVRLVSPEGLKADADPDVEAERIVEEAIQAFRLRKDLPRNIPEFKALALMGFSSGGIDVGKIIDALNNGAIKGIALLLGSNNVKYTQDHEIVSIAREFLKKDILCISEGEASVGLGKYGLLAPQSSTAECGPSLTGFLGSLGEKLPAVIDLSASEFLLAASGAKGSPLSQLPICAFFPEASRAMEVNKALWCVATGVSTYFWPPLPVTGSEKTVRALSELCKDRFGAELHVITRRMEARTKAELFLKSIEAPESLSGKPW